MAREFSGHQRFAVDTRRRVLIVDNHDDELTAFDELWREAGFETVTTWSAIEALGFLRSSTFNVLVVDDYVADMHVGEFLKRASQLSRAHAPAVAAIAKPKPHNNSDFLFIAPLG